MPKRIPRPRNATDLNNDGTIKLGDVHYETEPNLLTFYESDLINDDSSFCLQILLTIDLQCHVYPMSVFVCKRHF